MRELGELVDVAFDAADETFELGQDFVDVRGNFRHGAGENVEVVVAIHFQYAEIGPEGAVAGGRAGQALRSLRGAPRAGVARRADAVELVFFLELGNFAVQALFGKAKRIDEFFELGDATDHAGAVDDQLSDGVHHAVEAFEGDAHGLHSGIRLLEKFSFLSRRLRSGLRLGGWRFPTARRDGFFFLERGELRDATKQGIDLGAHFGFVGPLAVQRLLEDVDGRETEIDDGGGGLNLSIAETADQILDAVRDATKALESHLGGGTFYGVNGAEEAGDVFGIVVGFERDEAVADDLEMFFGFGLEEFEDFAGHLVVGWQGVEIGAGESRC